MRIVGRLRIEKGVQKLGGISGTIYQQSIQ